MEYGLSLLHDFLSFVKAYYWVPLILIASFGAYYGLSIHRAAWSDIRNTGTGFIETSRLAQGIFLERRAKRDWPTMIYCYGLPPIIALWIAVMFLG